MWNLAVAWPVSKWRIQLCPERRAALGVIEKLSLTSLGSEVLVPYSGQ